MQSNIAGLQQPIRDADTTSTTNMPVSTRLPPYTKGILPHLQSRAPRREKYSVNSFADIS